MYVLHDPYEGDTGVGRHLFLGGTLVGHLVVSVEVHVRAWDRLHEVVPRLLGVIHVGATLDLIPFVLVGLTVAVHVVGDHDHTWFAAATIIGLLILVTIERIP